MDYSLIGVKVYPGQTMTDKAEFTAGNDMSVGVLLDVRAVRISAVKSAACKVLILKASTDWLRK